MGSYYYLAAQLPSLQLGLPAPTDSGAFRALCTELLTKGDAALLDRCSLEPAEGDGATGSFLIDSWISWERALRLNLASERAAKLKRELPFDIPADPLDAAAAAKAASAVENPLEAELQLIAARWSAIESFEGFDYFGRDTAYAYLLKLLLLERKALFRAEEGFAEYKAAYASVMEAASTSILPGEPK